MANSVFLDLGGGEAFVGQSIGPAADNTATPPFSFLGDLTTGYASAAAGTLDLMLAGSKGLELSTSAATFLTGVVGAFSRSALGTTSTDALTLSNATAATAGVTVQMSPRMRWRGAAWDTSASQTVDFFSEALPATAATPTGTWRLGYSLNGASAVFPLLVTSAGGITGLSGGFILSGGSMFSAAASNFGHNSRTLFTSPADGTENIQNNAGTAGIGLDVNTDGTLKIRVKAQNAYGTVDALAYNASGAAGISTTITTGSLVGKTITVTGGVITGFA